MSRAKFRPGIDKKWTPDARQHYTIAPVADGETGHAWLDNGRIVATKPDCGEPGCTKPAMTWNQCACGKLFALCADHAVGDRSTSKERAAHNATCAAMAARFAR